MSTVGLNFGSVQSGTGFDVTATVGAILANTSAIENPWKAQLANLKAQDAVFSTLGSDLSTLSTALTALTDFNGVLAAKLGSSSDTNTLSLSSASTAAIAGSHTVTVQSLATTSSNYSDPVAPADVLSGSLSIGVGSATPATITIDSTNNTLATLAAAINQGAYGVNASVVTDSSGSRLSIVSNTSGSSGQIALTSNLADVTTPDNSTPSHIIQFAQGQPGADATLRVDGRDTNSPSNTVTNLIPGVTFQLLASSATPIQIQITNDNSSIGTAFSALVTAYNQLTTDIKTQEGNDATGHPQPLYGNTVISTLQSQLSQSLFGGSPSGAIKSVAQLGLSLDPTGKLVLDHNVLTAVLNSNFSEVTGFLQNAESFGQTFSKSLSSLGNTPTKGDIFLALKQNAAQEAQLNTNVANEDLAVAAQKIILTKELSAANQILQSIPSQLAEVDQIYAASTGYNTTAPG